MNAGLAQLPKNARKCRAERVPTGALAHDSDSILRDSRAPYLSNCAGRRQTEQATLSGTKIPCLQRPYNEIHFFFWNQSVAAKVKDGPRQLKFVYGSQEPGGSAMATLSHFCASLLYGVFSENLFRPEMPSSWLTPEV